ncbi:MAG: tetratricopeptide repeat protein [Gammaproteobacteria bacterium]|nr:tetratricopeptide repeat protein [Gammaproteobacteria bacterium]
MSVINNVLKNLETRESGFTPIEITSVASPPASRRDPKPLLFGVLLLLLLAAAGWIYLQPGLILGAGASAAILEASDVGPGAPVPAQRPDAAAVDEGTIPDNLAGNQIVGLQLHESEQEMRMEFVLRDRVVVYLKERGENSFGYHLRQVESRIVAPVIKDNRWIRELSISGSENGVDIYFETTADILVETRQSLVDGEPVWAINLRQARTARVEKPEIEVASLAPVSTIQPVADAVAAEVAEPAIETPAADRVLQTAPVESLADVPEVRLEIRSTNPDAEAENQLDYAVELIRSRRTTDAESLLRGLIGGKADYSARQHLLALYGRQNQAGRFTRLLQDSMIRYPQDQMFRTEFVRSLFQGAAYREVIRLLGEQTELDAIQQALLAASYQRLDQHEDAVRHYRLALELDAGNARNWIGLGISQEQGSALADALDSYQRAARLGTLSSRLRAFVDKRSDTLRQVLN